MKRRLPWNWKSRLVLIREFDDYITDYKLCFRKGETPRGFHRQIGLFTVQCNFIHSEIDEVFQNRGLGLLCYRTILHEAGVLYTRYHSASPQAQSVWRKLIKIYPHDKDFWTTKIRIRAKNRFVGFPIE